MTTQTAIDTTNATETDAKKVGRPLSEKQAKVRNRIAGWIERQQGTFTIKDCAKGTKQNRMHVTNAVRWAENNGLVKMNGYADNEGRSGRKERVFTVS